MVNMTMRKQYRVKLLRQRHDELVEQLRKRERDMEAAATARKYRKIAGICRLIKPKYEYTGEVYSIVVPSGVRDIMREGDALSHCVGKSDRYWERIEQQEAYILFLRKTAEIDKPYYTLEVEPNGTIRQKRTYFDRQNDDLKEMAKNVAMQIAALRPQYTNRDEVSADYIAHEKEILMAQIQNDPKESQKPEKVIQGMIQGRINKELKEICLLDQVYVCLLYTSDAADE